MDTQSLISNKLKKQSYLIDLINKLLAILVFRNAFLVPLASVRVSLQDGTKARSGFEYTVFMAQYSTAPCEIWGTTVKTGPLANSEQGHRGVVDVLGFFKEDERVGG